MAVDLRRLQCEHGDIKRLAAELLKTVGIGDAGRTGAAQRLHDLAGSVAAHVEYETGLIYPELMRDERRGLSGKAMAYAGELSALRTDWQRYVRAWSPARVAADWCGFGAATCEIVPRMLDRIEREEACLRASVRSGGLTKPGALA